MTATAEYPKRLPLSEATHREFKGEVARIGTSIVEAAEEAAKDWIKKKRTKSHVKRT